MIMSVAQITLHLSSGVHEMRGACKAPREPKLLIRRTWKSNLLALAENWMQTGCLSTRWSLVTTATFSSSQQSRSKSSLLNDSSPCKGPIQLKKIPGENPGDSTKTKGPSEPEPF